MQSPVSPITTVRTKTSELSLQQHKEVPNVRLNTRSSKLERRFDRFDRFEAVSAALEKWAYQLSTNDMDSASYNMEIWGTYGKVWDLETSYKVEIRSGTYFHL